MRCVLMRGNDVISDLNSKDPITTNTIKSKRDVNKLRASIAVGEQKEEKENYRPTIKTHDDVKLKVELRGRRKSPDVDKIAIEKDKQLEKNTPCIEVSLNTPTESEKPEAPLFSAMISRQYDEMPSLESTIVEKEEEPIVEETVEEVTVEPEEIVVEEEVATELEETAEEEVVIPEAKEGWSIGELIGDKIESFNENYKTNKIVSPIEGHYAKEEVVEEPVKEENLEVENTIVEEAVETIEEEIIETPVEETVTVEEEVVEEETEIPELIIHPRKEEVEDEEETGDSEDNINLY